MSRRARRAVAVALATAALVALTGAALGQVRERTLGVWWVDDVPRLTFSARDVATRRVRRGLDSGLPKELAMTVLALPQNGRTPIAVEEHRCTVTYDLLEDRYRVEVEPGAGRRQTLALRTLDEVLARCAVFRQVPVGTAAQWSRRAGASIYFSVLVEFEPVSRRDIQQLRRWLATSGGTRADGDASYGAFVSIFVDRDIAQAERTVKFRSQIVTVPR